MDIGKGLSFYEYDGTITKAVNAGSGWTDWDLSAYLFPGAKAVIGMVVGTSWDSAGIRKKGSTNDRRSAIAQVGIITQIVEADANGFIQVYDASAVAGHTNTYSLWGQLY